MGTGYPVIEVMLLCGCIVCLSYHRGQLSLATILWLDVVTEWLHPSVERSGEYCLAVGPVTSRVAPDIISGPGPGRNPAKFSYPDMAAGYEVGFDHLSMHLPHCVCLLYTSPSPRDS